VRSQSRGAVERWANTVVLYISVKAPCERGAGDFWEAAPGGDVVLRPDASVGRCRLTLSNPS